MDPGERRLLLALARDAIRAEVLGDEAPSAVSLPDAGPLAERGAAFVTIHKRDESRELLLRGCIGTFDRSRSLAATVREMAVAAAARDPRFPSVRADEIPHLVLDISVISEARRSSPDAVVVGKHGLQISRGAARGVLLPQVATERRWDRERFLQETCRKAGLPPDAWKDPTTLVEVFEAEVFGEQDTPPAS